MNAISRPESGNAFSSFARSTAAAACVGAMLALGAMAGPVAAQGRSLEDRYIAARDAATARFTPEMGPKLGDNAVKAEETVRARLERHMRAIVGPVAIEGLGAGRLSLGSLYPGDIGFGTLDGILF